MAVTQYIICFEECGRLTYDARTEPQIKKGTTSPHRNDQRQQRVYADSILIHIKEKMAATALLIAAMTATVGFGVDAFVVLPSFTTVSDTNYIFISVGGSKSSTERKNGVDRKREDTRPLLFSSNV